MNLTPVSKCTGPLFPLPCLFWAGDHSWITTDKSGFISCHFDLGFKGRGSLCRYKSNIHTHREPRVWCFDLVLTLCCFVCQLNNGLAGIKASHCHNYTPAVINPMCFNVIIAGTVYTPEHCISIQRFLFYPPRLFSQKHFVSLSQTYKHTHIWSRAAKPQFSVVDTWAASREQLRCKRCDQKSRWIPNETSLIAGIFEFQIDT